MVKKKVPRPRSWLPLVARVEWRSEQRGKQRPVAVHWGGERLALEVVEAWVEGPDVAGDPVVRVFLGHDSDGRCYRIRSVVEGATFVELGET